LRGLLPIGVDQCPSLRSIIALSPTYFYIQNIHGENVMAEADGEPSMVKKQTDDGWSIVIYNVGAVTVQDKFFASEADADAYLQERQALIDEGRDW